MEDENSGSGNEPKSRGSERTKEEEGGEKEHSVKSNPIKEEQHELRNIHDEEDEVTVFDDTQWADVEGGKDALDDGKDEAPDPGKELEEMAEQNQEEQLDEVPGAEQQKRKELDAYLDKRPWISLGLRGGALLAQLAVLGPIMGIVQPWLEPMSIAVWLAVGMIPLVSGVALVWILGFALFWHVSEAGEEGVRQWKMCWKIGPLMADAWAFLSLAFAGSLCLAHSQSLPPSSDGAATGGGLKMIGLIISGALAIVASLFYIATAVILYLGKIL